MYKAVTELPPVANTSADVDVPAGNIGTGAREIGFLFGQYKRILKYLLET